MRHLPGDRAGLTRLERSLGDRLRARLDQGGAAWPGPVEYEQMLPSTNDRLKERARAGAPAWSVLVAGEQTAGRGRQGNAWVSPRGNLFLSLLLRPSLPADEAALIPLAAGVAVCDALRALGAGAELKWPNDVLVGDRKIGGILTEAVWGDGALDSVVVGVGVNVSVGPGDIAQAVASLAEELGRDVPLEEVAAAVLEQLALWYHRLATGERRGVVEAWRKRSVPWWGRSVEVRVGAGSVRGVARGISDAGALLVEGTDGGVLTIMAGEARAFRLG